MNEVRHPAQQYKELRAVLTEKGDQHFTSFIRVSSALHRYWSKELKANELQVLMFIVGRTLSYKKRAETIAFRHFTEGVTQFGKEVCAPCGLGTSTVRAALKSLAERGFIQIHAFFQGNVESLWRIYEVNVEQILEIVPMKSRTAQHEEDTKLVRSTPYQNSTPPPY